MKIDNDTIYRNDTYNGQQMTLAQLALAENWTLHPGTNHSKGDVYIDGDEGLPSIAWHLTNYHISYVEDARIWFAKGAYKE